MSLRTSFLLLALLVAASAGVHAADEAAIEDRWTPTQKVIATDLAVAAFIVGWGYANWDYGQEHWHARDEGWFGQSTDEGGADKGGHFYATYALGRGLTGLFRHYGYDHDKAVLAGVGSSLGAMMLMELGDGYSPYGYSEEDAAMNLLGAGAAWLLATQPSLDRKLALRGEYHVNRHEAADFFTDYERWRYYLVLKLEGFEAMPEPLRWIELHSGYFARGYADDVAGNEQRTTFVGLGFNFSKLAKRAGWKRTGVFLDYFQVPHTAWREDNER